MNERPTSERNISEPHVCEPQVTSSSLGEAEIAQALEKPLVAPVAERGKGLRNLGLWVRDLAISIAIAAFFIIFLYQPVKVEGTSMAPGLKNEERIFINKFVYHFESISRGDVIVFHPPIEPDKSYIKRVIAGPGDRVRIDDGRVYVNDVPLQESYVPSKYEDFRSYPETVVPAHSYFVLGDHRNLSKDSRDFGPVDETFIYGKAVFAYWPMKSLGTLR